MLFNVEDLPDQPTVAAAYFHAHVLPDLLRALDGTDHLLLAFPPADHTHRAWRLAVVQGLARELAPKRINGAEGTNAVSLAATHTYLDHAPGVTGQYWSLDGRGS